MKVAASPQILALCTALALLILAVVSFPQWKSLLSAEPLAPKTVIGMGNRSSLEMMTARR